MAFLTCDEPHANQKFLVGPLTVANGGVSFGNLVAARAKIMATLPAEGSPPPDPAVDPKCVELDVDTMTGLFWWLGSGKVIEGIEVGDNFLVLWGTQDGANWEVRTGVPIEGFDQAPRAWFGARLRRLSCPRILTVRASGCSMLRI